MGRIGAFGVVTAALLLAGQARAECTVAKLAELPITFQNQRLLVPAKIEGADVRFEVDTGAFFSTITPQAAAYHHMKLGPLPPGVTVYGVGGQVRIQVATVKSFTLDGIPIPDVDFMVGGGEIGPRIVGLLGENVLHLADDDFDLKAGKLTLLRPKDCKTANLAYWTAGRGVSTLDFEAPAHQQGYNVTLLNLERQNRDTLKVVATARVNGQRIRVVFDTGAATSVLTLAAAERAGIRPDSPGVISAGYSGGLDQRRIQTWIAPVDSFEVGGEQIKNTKLRIGDIGVVGTEAPDMLLGADFFRSHHVLISHSQRKIYFTYEGGSVFDLSHAPQTTTTPGAASPP